MRDVYEIMKELNIKLPEAPAKGGLYSPAKRFGDRLVYISGCGPIIDKPFKGVLGREYDKEEGLEIARNAMLNVLAVLEREIGDLNKVKHPVKILTFIASDNSFEEQPYVANGGSQLLLDLFGADNVPSRSAIGVNVLPGGIPLETEAIFELKED